MNGIKNCNIALENEVVKNEIPVSITIEKSKNKIKKKLENVIKKNNRYFWRSSRNNSTNTINNYNIRS